MAWASILEILYISSFTYQLTLNTVRPSIMTPFFENKSNVFVCCAIQGRIFCTAGEIFAVVGPGDAARSNAERCPGHRHSLKPARTPEQGGSSLSAECTFSPQCAHSALPVLYYYNVHRCTTALLTPTTCTQRGPRGLISATNPRGAPHASRESHNPAWQLGAFYHHHPISSQ